MSEATRNLALAHAIAHHSHPKAVPASPEEVAATADTFNDFITADSHPTPAPAQKVTAPKATKSVAEKPKAAKPVKAAPVEEPEEAAEEGETSAEDAEGPSKEDVGNAIASLINSNLSAECGALLKKYGAKSLSGVPAAKYGAFISEAEALLMNA